ncbi:unnamed protein product [Symbiodinium necroappetens]|uniref:Uncharacterized protein n=1 Tax=Symbiodinium necroappetens TaxID=1628268 RepID=A0A813BCR1_9DINO|nr:unnamed protein product [Symbiodinium necroappetens]
MAAGEGREEMVGIFLRNIPAKCDQGILCSFLHTKGLTDFEIEMALFPDGKSRGFAVIHCCQTCVQTFVGKVHGEFVPGFGKTTPLYCEAFRGKGPRRFRQSTCVLLGEPALPVTPGPCGCQTSAFNPNTMEAGHVEPTASPTASGSPSETVDLRPACTIVLSAEGKLSFFL